MILSTRIRQEDAGRLNVQALMFGVEAETVDQQDGQVYIDLNGDIQKSIRVALRAGAQMLAAVEQVPTDEMITRKVMYSNEESN